MAPESTQRVPGREVTVLGLTPVFERIKAIETEYAQLHVERRADSPIAKLPQARQVRPHTDEAFEVVCQYIQASYLFSEVAADRTMMEELAVQMNRAATEFKATHKGSASLKKTAEEKRMEKMLRAFETENSFAPGALKLTGKTAKGEGNAKLYELVLLSGDSIWVKVEKDKLVKVAAPVSTD